MGMYRTVRGLSLTVALCVTLSLTGCNSNIFDQTSQAGSAGEITIGSPNVPEGRLLAELYGQVLSEHSYDVFYNFGVGTRESYIRALQSELIDVIPDYSGDVLQELAQGASEKSVIDVSLAAKKALLDVGLIGLDPSSGQNRRSFVITREFASAHSIESMSDLKDFPRTLLIGATEGTPQGGVGRAPLEKQYEITDWSPVDFPAGQIEAALDSLAAEEVDIVVLASASTQVRTRNLVVLTDPRSVFTAKNVMPIVTSDLSTRSVIDVLDSVSDALTDEALQILFARQANSRAPGDSAIAREWLLKNSLIAG
ncbi:MAG: glycine betaine ABC transporter substrate-binding protein [Microbacteriaceae bacterium]